MYQCPRSLKCISIHRLKDTVSDCPHMDDENMDRNCIRRTISFQTICDGYIELVPIIIDGRNETECKQWQCNNIYTNCPNGADENNCFSYSTLKCSSDYYRCISTLTNQFICFNH